MRGYFFLQSSCRHCADFSTSHAPNIRFAAFPLRVRMIGMTLNSCILYIVISLKIGRSRESCGLSFIREPHLVAHMKFRHSNVTQMSPSSDRLYAKGSIYRNRFSGRGIKNDSEYEEKTYIFLAAAGGGLSAVFRLWWWRRKRAKKYRQRVS